MKKLDCGCTEYDEGEMFVEDVGTGSRTPIAMDVMGFCRLHGNAPTSYPDIPYESVTLGSDIYGSTMADQPAQEKE